MLGVLPGGRGNDLARVLGIPTSRRRLRVIAEGLPRALDLGLVEPLGGGPARAFVGIASVGFDSDANRIANEAPSWLGGLVYAYGAMRALLSWRPARFELELDGGERSRSADTPSRPPTPRLRRRHVHGARRDARRRDARRGRGRAREQARVPTQNLPSVFKGTHVDVTTVRVFRSSQVTISADRPFETYADGDPVGALPCASARCAGAVSVLDPEPERRPSPRAGASPRRRARPAAAPAS